MLRAIDRSVGITTAIVTQRLSATAAIGCGRRFWMILAIHNVSLNVNPRMGLEVATLRVLPMQEL